MNLPITSAFWRGVFGLPLKVPKDSVDLTFASLGAIKSTRQLPLLTFTSTDFKMSTKKQTVKDLRNLLDDKDAEIADLRKTITAQVTKIHNLQDGAANDFNRLTNELERARAGNEVLSRDRLREMRRAESAEQSAATRAKKLYEARKTNEQLTREIANLRKLHDPTDVFAGKPFLLSSNPAGKTVAALTFQRDQALATARDFRARAEAAERTRDEWKKGLLTGNLIIDGQRAEFITKAALEHLRSELEQQRAAARTASINLSKSQLRANEIEQILALARNDFQRARGEVVTLRARAADLERQLDLARLHGLEEVRIPTPVVGFGRDSQSDIAQRLAAVEGRIDALVKYNGPRVDWLMKALGALRDTIVGGAIPPPPVLYL